MAIGVLCRRCCAVSWNQEVLRCRHGFDDGSRKQAIRPLSASSPPSWGYPPTSSGAAIPTFTPAMKRRSPARPIARPSFRRGIGRSERADVASDPDLLNRFTADRLRLHRKAPAAALRHFCSGRESGRRNNRVIPSSRGQQQSRQRILFELHTIS